MLLLISYKSFLTALLIIFFALQSSVTAQQANESKPIVWQAPYFQDNPLVGNIWDTYKQDWISEKQLKNELLHYDYILLGETHNNPDHHELQASFINYLVRSGSVPTVVMEMLQQSSWQDQPLKWNKVQELQKLASMLNDGWKWELYTPILKSVVDHQLELFAANVSREELYQWANQQSSDNINMIFKKYSLTEGNFSTLKKNIIDSHCGHANEGFVNFMSRAQMQRDHVMTTSLLGKKVPVVFIAGSGHTRNDYAVPMQLRKRFNRNSYISIAFMSVQKELDDPQKYLQGITDLYDVIYFTPSHINEDPCEKFRKQLKNVRHKQVP